MEGHEYHDLKMNKIISMGVFNPRPGRAKPGDRVTLLRPIDDLPPSTVITHVMRGESSDPIRVKGVAIDDYEIKRVVVNGREAKPLRPTSPSGRSSWAAVSTWPPRSKPRRKMPPATSRNGLTSFAFLAPSPAGRRCYRRPPAVEAFLLTDRKPARGSSSPGAAGFPPALCRRGEMAADWLRVPSP